MYNTADMAKSVYRIIDANFNRARESLRVVEEFCRFALDSGALSKRAKEIRHRLCLHISKLSSGRLIASRDTTGDVGVGRRVNGEISRRDLHDTVVAACKRLSEALRSLAEMVQTLDVNLSNQIERLRYDCYTLEKDVLIFADTTEKFSGVGLYVIISSDLPSEVLSLSSLCAAGGADCIQLRAKNISDKALFFLAREFVKVCRGFDVVSIINDRVDIAISSGADGVHLGQGDLPVHEVRELESYPLIIGVSTHTQQQLEQACRELPTYVSLGPCFKTSTKPDADVAGLDYVVEGLRRLEGSGIQSVAIGGITPDNLDEVAGSGVRCVAVCKAITASPDPKEMCRIFKQRIYPEGYKPATGG